MTESVLAQKLQNGIPSTRHEVAAGRLYRFLDGTQVLIRPDETGQWVEQVLTDDTKYR